MRIDFHTHIWEPQRNRVADFIRGLDRNAVDKAVVHPIAPHVSNETVAACVREAPDRLIGFASVLPFAETTGVQGRRDPREELEHAVADLGLRGLKLHPTIQGFSLDDPGLVPLLTKAAELGVPVLFHTGPSAGRAGRLKNALIEHIDDLAMMCPNTVIIAAHGEMFQNGPYIAMKHPNVYLDTAIVWERFCRLIPGLGEEVIKVAGKGKILFGTDYNVDRQERLSGTLGAIEALQVDDDTKAAVLGGTAARILKR